MSQNSHASHSEGQDEDGPELIKADYGQAKSAMAKEYVKFPNVAYKTVCDGLAKTPNWVAYPDRMAELLNKISLIEENQQSLSVPQEKIVDTTVATLLPDLMPKILDDTSVLNWPPSVHKDILNVCKALVRFTICRMTQLVSAKDEDLIFNYSVDLSHMFTQLALAFDPTANFHVHNQEEEIPNDWNVSELTWSHALLDSDDASKADDLDTVITLEQHLWAAHLINFFGRGDGFELMSEIFSHAERYNSVMLDSALSVLAKGDSLMEASTCEYMWPSLEKLLEYVQESVLDNPISKLANGKTRDYFPTVSSMLEKIDAFLKAAQNTILADAELLVAKVRRELILKLLAQGSFSKHLAAVRETNNLLMKALNLRTRDQGRAVRVSIEWMRKNDVVKNLLRANLHQKQYVDQVQKVLKNLTIEGGLQEDHLDLLWNLTEKVDTFEVVKNNIFDMLGDLAQEFNNEQLDSLFRKFESCRARPMTDAMKIMDVMRRFAASDTKGVMAKRVMDLLWSIMMNPEAPKEVSRSAAMTDALAAYAQRKVAVDREVACEYIRQCLAQIASDCSVSAAMNLLQKLVTLCYQEDALNAKTAPSLSENDFSLVDTVIGSLERHVGRHRAACQSQGGAVPSDVYKAVLMEYATFLISLPAEGSLHISWSHIDRLWHVLVENPVMHVDRLLGLQLLCELARNGSLSIETMRQILEEKLQHVCIANLADEENVSFNDLFSNCFKQVATAENKWEYPMDASDPPRTISLDMTGLPVLWSIVLDMSEDSSDRLDLATRTLITIYTSLKDTSLTNLKVVRAEVVQKCLAAVTEASTVLMSKKEGAPAGHELAARQAARALSLLIDFVAACQGKTMPRTVMHAASFRGNQRTFSVASQRNLKFRILSHTNMYIGQLRTLVAAKLSAQPENLRMIAGGKELNTDAALIRDKNLPESTHIMTTVSPQPNGYTKLPEELFARLEETSPANILSSSKGIYSMLLDLADFCEYEQVRSNVMAVLDLLPTDPDIVAELEQSLKADQPQQALRGALQVSSSSPRPARLLYVLQALNALLFPIGSGGDEAGQTPQQKAFICSGCVAVLIEAIRSVPPQSQQGGGSMLKSLFSATQSLFGQLIALSTKISCTSSGSGMADSSSPQRDSAPKTPTPSKAPAQQNSALDKSTLSVLLLFYLDLITQVCRQQPTSNSVQQGGLGDEQDATLCIDAFDSMEQLMQLCPPLNEALFSDPSAREVLSNAVLESLLNSEHELVRSKALLFSQRLACASTESHINLLRLLSDFSRADEHRSCCKEYYALLCDLVRNQPDSAEADERRRSIAGEMLDQLVEMTTTMTAQDDNDLTLQWKLRLLLVLVQVLERRDVGSPNGLNLVHKLITEYLFPESWFLHNFSSKEQVQNAPLQLVGQALHARCNESQPEDRQAALDLLQDLMSNNSSNLQEGMELIRKIHLSTDIIAVERLDHKVMFVTKRPHAFVGLRNGGATCYMNSVFQQLFMQPSIRRSILSAAEPNESPKVLQDNVFYQLQTVFANLAMSNREVYMPKCFWRAFKDYDGEELNIREHQDGYEFFTRLQDVVDQQMKMQGHKPAMQLVMGGKFAQQIICKNVSFRSEKEEDFYQISLDVRGKRNLQESLDFYVQGELMEGDNQYLCEDLGIKTDAVKRSCIKVLPHMLVIHLKRFEYDYETMTRGKIKDRFEFPEELDMYNYTVTGMEAKEAKEAASSTEESLSGSEETGGRAPMDVTDSADAFRAQCQYQLKGVVVHSGTAFAGHYYSYIKVRKERGGRDSTAGQWYCFDDTTVRPWDIADLETDCFGGKYSLNMDTQFPGAKEFERPNSAYMLFYERSEELEPIENISSLALDPLPDKPVDSDVATLVGSPTGSASEVVSEPVLPIHSCTDSPIASLLAVPIPDIARSIPNVYTDVLSSNLRVLQELRLLDRQYFKFMLTLVKKNSEAVTLPPASLRRTEAACSSSTSSPSGLSAEMASALKKTVTVSARRDDKVDQAAETLINFAGQFLLRIYFRCAQSLREDQATWGSVLSSVMEANLAANKWWLFLITCDSRGLSAQELPENLTMNFEHLENFLLWCAAEDISKFVATLTLSAVKHGFEDDTPNLQKAERGSFAWAIILTLNGVMDILAKKDLLHPKNDQKYFPIILLRLIKDLGYYSSAIRSYCNNSKILRMFQQRTCELLLGKDNPVEVTILSFFEAFSPYLRGVECGPPGVSYDEAPNPYALEGWIPNPSRSDFYDFIAGERTLKEWLTHPVLLRHSDELCELWKFLMWSNQNLTMMWIRRYCTVFIRQWTNPEVPQVVLKTAYVKDQWHVLRIAHMLVAEGGILPYAANASGLNVLRRYQTINLIVRLCQLHPDVFSQTVSQNKQNWLRISDWLENIGSTNPQFAESSDYRATDNLLQDLLRGLSDDSEESQVVESGSESTGDAQDTEETTS